MLPVALRVHRRRLLESFGWVCFLHRFSALLVIRSWSVSFSPPHIDFTSKNFEDFDDPKEVIHITKLQGGLNIAELYHGPTLAFKDIALSVVGSLVDNLLEKKKKKAIVLVGELSVKRPCELVLSISFHCRKN